MKKISTLVAGILLSGLVFQPANAANSIKAKPAAKINKNIKPSLQKSIPVGKAKYLVSNNSGANLDTATVAPAPVVTPAPVAPAPVVTPAPVAPAPVVTPAPPIVPATNNQADTSTAVISKLIEMVKSLMDANSAILALAKSAPTNSVVTTVNPVITVNPIISPSFQQASQNINSNSNLQGSPIVNNSIVLGHSSEEESNHK